MRSGKVFMESPDGSERAWVEPSRVKHFIEKGGRVVPKVRMKVDGAGGPIVREFHGARVPFQWQDRGEVMAADDSTKSTPAMTSFLNIGRKAAMETARQAPLYATMAAGGALARPAFAAAGPVVRALTSITGMGAAQGAGQAVTEGASRALGYGDAPGTVGGAAQQGALLTAGGEAAAPIAYGIGVPAMMWAQSHRGGVSAREAGQRALAAIRERIPVGNVPFRPDATAGSKRASALRMARDAAADAEAATVSSVGPQVGPGVYAGGGVKFRMNRLSPRLRELVARADRIPGYETSAKKLRGMVSSLFRKYGGRDLPLDEVRELRQDMDVISAAIKEGAPGKNKKAFTPVKQLWDAISNDMRDVLRHPSVGPSVSEAERGVQSAILSEKGALSGEKGLSWAASRGLPAAAGGIASWAHQGPVASEIPQILAAGGAAALVSQPWFASRAALGLTDPIVQMLLRRGPALAGAAARPQEP